MSEHPAAGGFEPDELDLGAIVKFTIGLIALVVVAGLLMWLLSTELRQQVEAEDPPPPVLAEARARHEPPAPRLQATPELELVAFAEAEARDLESYGWVDREAGVARVPLERAIELLVERGIGSPTEPATETDTETGTETDEP